MSTRQVILVSSPTATTPVEEARISDDGRYVAFSQDGGGVNSLPVELVTKDLLTGVTTVIDSSNPTVGEFDLSTDGSSVAYWAQLPGAIDEVTLWDRSTSTSRTLLSVEVGPSGDIGEDIDFSSNGQYVEVTTYPSASPNTLPDDIELNVQTGAEQDLFQNTLGEVAQSADGRYVLVGGFTASTVGQDSYFRLDTTNGALVSLAPASADITNISFSGDGRYAVFETAAALLPEDTNNATDVYIKDFSTGDVQLVSTSSAGAIGNGYSGDAVISADGSRVAFLTKASNLAAGVPNEYYELVLKDLATGILVDVALAQGTQVSEVRNLDISADGLSIAFTSGGRLTEDANSLNDAYVVSFKTPTISITSVAGDNYVNAAEEGAPITVNGVSNDPNGHVVVTSPTGATASTSVASDGTWSVAVAASGLADGPHNFTATITDDVAAFLTATATLSATYDTVPPALTLSVDGGDAINAAQLHAAVISGASDAIGQSVTITIDGKVIGTAVVNAPAIQGDLGSWSFTYNAAALTEGQHSLDVQVADAAGNVTRNSTYFDVDTTPPKIAIQSIAGDNVVDPVEDAGLVPIVGTSDAIGQTVTITADNQVLGTAVVQSDGSWTAEIALDGAAGSTIVFAQVADPAGNIGAATGDVFVDTNTLRVSVASDGAQGEGDPSGSFGFVGENISADGRYVLFGGDITSLTPEGGYLIKDLRTGELSAPANSGDQLSRDGDYVVASLGTGIEVLNRTTGAITEVDTAADGTPDNGSPTGAYISDDGDYVVFASTGTNLVSGLAAQDPDDVRWRVFAKNLQTGEVSLVSFAQLDEDPYQVFLSYSNIADDRYVAFASTVPASASDTNGMRDIFVRDITTGAITLVSATPTGQAGNGENYAPQISADGRYVAFFSEATNLIAGQVMPAGQAYVRDLSTGKTMLLSAAADGTPIGAYASEASPGVNFVFTSDDRYVAFYTREEEANNLSYDVYLKDLQTGALTLLSGGGEDHILTGGEIDSFDMTPDGRYLMFSTSDPSLVPYDTNNIVDVFVRRLDTSDTVGVNPIGDDNVVGSGDAPVAVSGHTSISGGTVSILIDGTVAATTGVNADGSWATTVEGRLLPVGAHTLVASVQDEAGFTTSRGVAVEVTTDSDSTNVVATSTYVSAHIDALEADTHLQSITLTDAPGPLVLTVEQALVDTAALHTIQETYQILIEDTSANLHNVTGPQIQTLAAEGVTKLVSTDASVAYGFKTSAAIQAAGIAVSAPANDFVRLSLTSTTGIVYDFNASDVLYKRVTTASDGTFDNYFYNVAGVFNKLQYESFDAGFTAAGVRNSVTYYAATGYNSTGDRLATRTVHSDGSFDVHYFETSATFAGVNYPSYDVAFTAAGTRDAATYFAATGPDAVKMASQVNNPDGTIENSFFNQSGAQPSYQNDLPKSGTQLAHSFENAGGLSGQVNIQGSGLTIDANSGNLGPSSAPKDFTFNLFATENYSFISGASDDKIFFSSGFGAAVIKSFASAPSTDILDLSSLFSNLNQAQSFMSDVNGATVITDGISGDSLTINGVASSSLTAARLGLSS